MHVALTINFYVKRKDTMMVFEYFAENTVESLLFMRNHIFTSHPGLLITMAIEKSLDW